MMPYRRNKVAAERFTERRRREDEAPRLSAQVPDLVGLELEIQEHSGMAGTKHIRRVMVDSAPALFLIACGDPRCEGGEHDLTTAVMQGLRSHAMSFEGEDECTGALGPSPCVRSVHFRATAKYRSTRALGSDRQVPQGSV